MSQTAKYHETVILKRFQALPLKTGLLVLASLFLGEFSIGIVTLAIYMKGDRAWPVFISSKPGVVLLAAIAGSLIAAAIIIQQYRISKRSPSRHFAWIVMLNFVTVILVLMSVESSIRYGLGTSEEGERLGSTLLLPKNWEKMAFHHRELLAHHDKFTDLGSVHLSYMVSDPLLGWTIGPNKRSPDGLYSTSSEGIRAPHEGVVFGSLTGKTRIALVGDSLTFASEVTYEDTWGDRLEKSLGPDFQVLNFGVGGYGVDQAYLRYEKDVRMWKPKVVIYGFMSGAVRRTMNVYPFLSFPDSNVPFSKPRFILRDGELKEINVPALTPETIFAKRLISELPFLEYDMGYKPSEWENSLFHLPYLARLLVSKYPRSSALNPEVSDETLVSINTSILKAFVQSVAQSGAIPIVAYVPKEMELATTSSSLPIGKRILQEANIAYTDLTPCLLEVNPADRFLPGYHYSPQGNAAVANCLRTVVHDALAVPTFGVRQ